MRYPLWVAMLVGLWLLAWGQVSLANVLSGIAVAVALLIVFPLQPRTRRLQINPLGVARLAGFVVIELVVSNLVMSRQILGRRNQGDAGVLAHRLQQPSVGVITLMSSIIALSPGTMTVDVDTAASTIYVHFFRLEDVAAARRFLARLEHLIVDALASQVARVPPPSTDKEMP
jgi:multicomponent Na+:H+ antiporter subunit E